MATTQPSNGAADSQKHTVYPYYGLPKAINAAEIIRDLGGANQDVQKSQIAHGLGVPDDSPTLLGILGAARLYGLVDGRGAYRLTELAKSYFHPTSEGEKRIAHLKMVKSPPLFAALIDRFDGTKIPPNKILVNILHRDHRIAKSWQTRATSMFISALREAQLIDGSGLLRYKASLHGASNGNMVGMNNASMPSAASMPSIDRQPPAMPDPMALPDAKPRSGVAGWTYKGIRVEVPENLSMDLWKKLSDYVNVLKPEGD